MRSRPYWISITSLVAVGGASLLLFGIVHRRWKRSNSVTGTEKSALGDCNLQVESITSWKGAGSALPVAVVESKLAKGWSVAPPIFYPPHVAAISILQPEVVDGTDFEKGTCIIICDGPLAEPVAESRDVSLFFSEYMRTTPFLHSVVTSGTEFAVLSELGFSCASECFTHIVIIPNEKMIIAFGRNGPYVLSMVLTECTVFSGASESDDSVTQPLTSHDVQMLLNACYPVPLVDGLRFPGTPSGSREGILRVNCRCGDRSALFTVSSTVSVRAAARENRGVKRGNGDDYCSVSLDILDTLFILKGDVLPRGEIVVGGSTLDALVKGAEIDALFPTDTPEQLPVSSFFKFVAVDKHDGDDKVTPQNDDLDSGVSGMWCRGMEVTVVFTNATLGIHFIVSPTTGVIREPILTDDLLVLYYPLGDESTYVSSSGAAEKVTPPRVSIRHVTQIPPTWNPSLTTDDELKHKVLFHFTDWARERVSCLVCELDGLRCVQMYEEKGKHGCRTYVVSLTDAILVIRWEAEISEWDIHLPLLQSFLDTLHVVYREA